MTQNTNKIVISGNCGFIFSHVTDYFLNKGWNVIGIDDLSQGSHPELLPEWKTHENFTFYEMDVSDSKVQDLIIRENPEYIIHACAISAVDYSIKDPEYTLRQNILASINMFESARFCSNLKKFLYVSTDEVYGECEEKKNESDIIFPRNPYACSKATGSLLRLAYDNTYPEMKNKTCETRFCNVFGERQDPRKILSRIVQSFKDGSAVPVQNNGVGKREYIYVGNIPPVIDLILEKGDRVYNVTLNNLLSVNELIDIAQEVAGQKLSTTEDFRPGMDMIYQMDNSRLLELGWIPKFSIVDGLIKYFRSEKII